MPLFQGSSSLRTWSNPPPVLAGLAAAVVAGALVLAGAFDPLDWAIYDALHRAFPPAADRPPAIVLLEWDSQDPDAKPQQAERILTTLRDMGAHVVVFTDLPSAAELNLPSGSRGVVGFASRDVSSAAPRSLPHGVFCEQLCAGGVVRQHAVRATVNGQEYPTLDIVAARLAAPERSLPDQPYLVGYRGGPRSLPHVDARSLLAGELVPELVRGKVVLVGRPGDGVSPTLVAPTASERPGFSLLEYYGQAVNTLLTGTWIRTPPVWAYILLLLGTTLLTALVTQWLDVQAVLWVCIIVVVLTVVGMLSAFVFGRLWVPATGVVASQVACVFLVQRWKGARACQATQRQVFELSAATRDRSLPPPFAAADDPWSLLAGLARQTLDGRRMVFFAASRRRLKVAACVGVAPTDIREQRRRLTEEPYASAVKTGRPVRSDSPDRVVIPPAVESEVEYIVPISYAERVFGMWVVTTTIADCADELAECARQFGELLHLRKRRREGRAGFGWIARVFARGAEDRESERLAHLVRALRDRLERAEQLFAEGANDTASFDLFGRLLHANDAMRTRLQTAGLSVTQLSAADLIAGLTGRDTSFARRCVRHVLHDARAVSLPFATSDKRAFRLRVYPLMRRANSQSNDLAGVGCELTDQTDAVRLRKLKDQFAGRVGVILRNDLAAIELSASMLAADGLAAPDREEMATFVHDKVQQITRTLNDAQGFYEDDPGDEGGRLPVDPHPHFLAGVADVESAARTRGVTVTANVPPVLSYVVANPDSLRRFFGCAINVLTHDARPGSGLSAEVSETTAAVVYEMRNTGMGMPGDRLREYLTGPTEPADPDLRPLWDAARKAAEWGARLEADSTPGEGTVLRLCLPRFN